MDDIDNTFITNNKIILNKKDNLIEVKENDFNPFLIFDLLDDSIIRIGGFNYIKKGVKFIGTQKQKTKSFTSVNKNINKMSKIKINNDVNKILFG